MESARLQRIRRAARKVGLKILKITGAEVFVVLGLNNLQPPKVLTIDALEKILSLGSGKVDNQRNCRNLGASTQN